MHTIETIATVTADGKLVIDVPPDVRPGQHAVVVVIDQHAADTPAAWPTAFFDETAGALAATPMERAEQGTYEVRPPLR